MAQVQWRSGGEIQVTRKPAVHVSTHKDGWAVSKEGSKRASSVHSTQKAAAGAGRAVARRDKTEFVLHGRDGQIRVKDRSGNDPSPPKG